MAGSASCRFIKIAYFFETCGECSLGNGEATQVSRRPRRRIRQPRGMVLETLKIGEKSLANSKIYVPSDCSPLLHDSTLLSGLHIDRSSSAARSSRQTLV